MAMERIVSSRAGGTERMSPDPSGTGRHSSGDVAAHSSHRGRHRAPDPLVRPEIKIGSMDAPTDPIQIGPQQ